jgi:hypothetical protein
VQSDVSKISVLGGGTFRATEVASGRRATIYIRMRSRDGQRIWVRFSAESRQSCLASCRGVHPRPRGGAAGHSPPSSSEARTAAVSIHFVQLWPVRDKRKWPFYKLRVHIGHCHACQEPGWLMTRVGNSSPGGGKIFPLCMSSSLVLWPTQPPIQSVSRAFSASKSVGA